MNMTLIFVVMACVMLAGLAYLALRRKQDVRDAEQGLAAIRSLDIEAFRNLVDPEEEDFLRVRLRPKQFRDVKRARARAALAYTRALSAASLQIAHYGGAVQRNPDPAIAASGRELANSATYLRLRALQASANLMVSVAFPGSAARRVRPLLDQYDRATHVLERHNGLRRIQERAS